MPRHFNAEDAAFSADDEPITAPGYIGFTILFAIPLVGLISVLIFSFASKNQNRRSFARAALFFRIVCYALLALYVFVPPAATAMRELPAIASDLANRLLALLPFSL
ncbi:MAG: hypothetical protein ACI361_05430 [Atopobiaceae bacterium]